MFTLHCTQKLLARIKRPVAPAPPLPTTTLGNWYATALLWKPQTALLVNERTLLPVLTRAGGPDIQTAYPLRSGKAESGRAATSDMPLLTFC